MVNENVGKLEPMCTHGGHVWCCSCLGKQSAVPQFDMVTLWPGSANPTYNIPKRKKKKKMSTRSPRQHYLQQKKWRQPECLWADTWMNKTRQSHTVGNYSAIKGPKFWPVIQQDGPWRCDAEGKKPDIKVNSISFHLHERSGIHSYVERQSRFMAVVG